MLCSIDADLTPSAEVDLFRIKIWDRAADDEIVYDNQMGAEEDADPTTAIGGGSIVIYEGKDDSPPVAAPAALKPLPEHPRLHASFPNPGNPEVWIPYQLSSDSQVTIRIYDVSGRLVRTLDLGYKPAGFYDTRSKAAHWDGSNEAAERVGSGIYFYNIQAGEFVATKKMVVAK